ncbi:ABC transporter permease [Aeromicrobium sp. 636]|uniref:Transport permease protein n=1 Tax=Aeromicrobium senzhongii TaxID=2663859 RepID=A0A8I0EUP5_9ACTN|nr:MULTISPECIES: ABC transporter permease [Aeromicrobium]MBC9225425.1 ABC transporter permease [Aeromicrobium senzhongii]MCQ3997535.1 ABC transporter permease [Aeromicrobium sp. 636]MTB87461.1 ABC transporter permease [Aeromicrobium senzhongii]QNL95487.1 ABC transporter permease [Aeromicrobium senzhongii]
MSTITQQRRPFRALTDGWVCARRNLIKIKRVPEIMVFVLISPIMFVLLFAYVFGGAIDAGPGLDYKEFLIGGIFAQTVVFGATFSGAAMAEDMQKGFIDRFRSLPMARSAVLVGRTGADVVYNVLSLIIMALTGLLVGWRAHHGILKLLGAFALLLVFAYAVSWIMAWVGLIVPSVDVINNASFIVIMPLTFVSNAFVPTESFPKFLQPFVEWNPVSAVTQAVRELFGNVPDGVPVPDVWSLQHPVIYTLMWVVAIVAVFVPLSVRAYERATTK